MTKFERIAIREDEIFPEIGKNDGWIPAISGMKRSEILEMLEYNWTGNSKHVLEPIAEAVFQRDLNYLTISGSGHQWLTFSSEQIGDLHIPPPSPITEYVRRSFRLSKVNGLREYLENFSGMTEGKFPSSWYIPPIHEVEIVSGEESGIDWGSIGKKWCGSLTVYHIGSGSYFLVSEAGRCGIWNHDLVNVSERFIANAASMGFDLSEAPITDLKVSFEEFIERFALFLKSEIDYAAFCSAKGSGDLGM